MVEKKIKFNNTRANGKDVSNHYFALKSAMFKDEVNEIEEYLNEFGDNKWWLSNDPYLVAKMQLNSPYILLTKTSVCQAVSIVLDYEEIIKWETLDEDWYGIKDQVNLVYKHHLQHKEYLKQKENKEITK